MIRSEDGDRSMPMISRTSAALLGVFAAGSLLAEGAFAGDVEIVSATAKQSANGWTISVTLRHGDTGWDHYADLWEVYAPDGTLLGRRELAHPHVNEQPFTRSLSGSASLRGSTRSSSRRGTVSTASRRKTTGWSYVKFGPVSTMPETPAHRRRRIARTGRRATHRADG